MIFTKEDLEIGKASVAAYRTSFVVPYAVDEATVDFLERLITVLEQAWREREDQHTVISNLQQQNTELLEDVAALRLERDELRAEL